MWENFFIKLIQYLALVAECILLTYMFYSGENKRSSAVRRAIALTCCITVALAGLAAVIAFAVPDAYEWVFGLIVYAVCVVAAFLWFAVLYSDKYINMLFGFILAVCSRMMYIKAFTVIVAVVDFIEKGSWLDTLLSVGCFAAIYTLLYFLYVKKKRGKFTVNVDKRFFAYFLAIVVVLSALFGFIEQSLKPTYGVGYCVLLASESVSYLFFILYQVGMIRAVESRISLETTQNMLAAQSKQFESFRAAVDYLNLKCHDLKHQIREFENVGRVDRSVLTELKSSVDGFEAYSDTGCAALDIILGEKYLQCRALGVQLVSVVKDIDFSGFADSDIYALFGNALDNAIEHIATLPTEKRFVRLSAKIFGDTLYIKVENPFDGSLTLRDGLPVTVKADKSSHGFGVRSMKMTAAKYGGVMNFEVKDGLFCLTFAFPVNKVDGK